MASENSPELPPGWTEHVKVSKGRKIKYYINGELDKKFYSKLSVLRHIGANAGSPSQDTPQQSIEDKKTSSETIVTPQQNIEDSKISSETIVTPLPTESSGSHEWLPDGWTMKLKTKKSGDKYKCYIHNATGKKFYSKITAMRYIETAAGSPSHGTPHQIEEDDETSLVAKVTPLAIETPETLKWLPQGWIMEMKTKPNGKIYKIYVDPKTGRKFYSKPEVLRYLKTANQNICSSQPKKMETESVSKPHMGQIDGGELENSKDQNEPKGMDCTSISKRTSLRNKSNKTLDKGELGNTAIVESEVSQRVEMLNGASIEKQNNLKPNINELAISTSPVNPAGDKKGKVQKLTNKKFVIERATADGLPPGWIKEVKIEKKGKTTRRDPYYTDPVSGYAFRSHNDVQRYLKTGDINKCAIRPKKREELRFLSEVASDTIDGDKLDGSATLMELEGSQNLETMNGTSSALTKKQSDLSEQQGGKPNMDKSDGGASEAKSNGTQNREKVNWSNRQIVIERSTADGLPPGWIKEVKIEKRASGTRRDPYFTDPVSGYVFRSQKDALRYLDTGDVKQCTVRPRKREKIGFLSEGALDSVPPAADNQEGPEHNIMRQLFGGEENDGKVSSESADIERQQTATESLSHDLSSPSPGPKKKQARKTVASQNRTVPAPSTKIAEEEKPTESDNGKKQTNSSRSKRNNTELPSAAHRSSKRSKPFEGSTATVSNEEVAYEMVVDDIPPGFDVPNGSERPSSTIAEQETKKKDQPIEPEAEKTNEEDTDVNLHPFGDSWSDPCLEFAIKTLTGSLPDMDHMDTSFPPFTQEVNNPSTTTKVDTSCLTLLDFSSPSPLQSNVPPPSDVSTKPLFEGAPNFKHPSGPKPSPGGDVDHCTKLGL